MTNSTLHKMISLFAAIILTVIYVFFIICFTQSSDFAYDRDVLAARAMSVTGNIVFFLGLVGLILMYISLTLPLIRKEQK